MEDNAIQKTYHGEKKSATKVALKILQCPTCGASLKAKNSTDAITCVYCGNTIIPVTTSSPSSQTDVSALRGDSVKVDGIRTSSSALAYIEQFFEVYDWEAFGYAQTLSVAEIDRLIRLLAVSSADDKNTWFSSFKAVSIPYAHKIAQCKQILNTVIEEYKADNLEAYSTFDAYKRVSNMIATHKEEVKAVLEKYISYAAKYGASAAEVSDLNAEVATLTNQSVMPTYAKIEDIPEIAAFIESKNARIVTELAAEGIDAEKEYAKARALIDEQKYVDALNILLSLRDFSDTRALIEKLDKYFLLSDVLEITGHLYYFKKPDGSVESYDLHATKDGVPSDKALVKGISKMITNHADILYYLNTSKKLMQYNLSTKQETQLYKKQVDAKSIHIYGHKVFMLSRKSDDNEYDEKHCIIALDLTSGEVKPVVESAQNILSLDGNKLVFAMPQVNSSEEYPATKKKCTCILNVDTMEVVNLGANTLHIEGFINESVVYTEKAPNEYNLDLFIKPLLDDAPKVLIEKNIYKFCDIIAGKLFYYIGNSNNQTLININCDGTSRREWPQYISHVLFEQGGWLYFIRSAFYNSVLCKARLDGSKFSIIAADIEKFIEIKNGFLYYINDESALVKVRMDGSNQQTLCENVEEVLSVQEDKILFISIDDKISVESFEQPSYKLVKSIYAVDFTGSGKIKLAYNIKSAKTYDEKTVYFVAAKKEKPSDNAQREQQDILYKLDADTNQTEQLLCLSAPREESGFSGFAIAMCVMVFAILLAIIGFAADNPGIGVFGLLSGFTSMIVGVCVKFMKE